MTKKEKLKILLAMKEELKRRKRTKEYLFLCHIWSKCTGGFALNAPLKQLGLVRPGGDEWLLMFSHWWSAYDYTSRLRALNSAIRKLKA